MGDPDADAINPVLQEEQSAQVLFKKKSYPIFNSNIPSISMQICNLIEFIGWQGIS